MNRTLARALPILLGMALATGSSAAPPGIADLEDILGSVSEADPLRPVTTYRIKSLYVNSDGEFALVAYTQKPQGGEEKDKLGWIYLSNDRRINYKMTMLTLIRDALDNPSRSVNIQIVPGTENTSRRVISAVGIGPALN